MGRNTGMATRWARVARGGTSALFSTFVAALSHAIAGGGTPSLAAVATSLAFAGIICIGLAGRTLSLWRMSASVVVSQLIFHGLFSFGSPGGSLVVAAEPLPGVHDHGAFGLLAGSIGAAADPEGQLAAAMWAAHALAAVITIVALRHGESAFWGLFTPVRLSIRSLFGVLAEGAARAALPPIRSAAASTARVETPRDRDLVFSPMRHRGPPALGLS